MAIGLADIYEKLKELVTITDRVRENTERISKLEEKVDNGFKNVTEEIITLRKYMEKGFSDYREEFRAFREESRLSDSEIRGDIKAILIQLKAEERIDSLESMLKQHIAECEKAKA